MIVIFYELTYLERWRNLTVGKSICNNMKAWAMFFSCSHIKRLFHLMYMYLFIYVGCGNYLWLWGNVVCILILLSSDIIKIFAPGFLEYIYIIHVLFGNEEYDFFSSHLCSFKRTMRWYHMTHVSSLLFMFCWRIWLLVLDDYLKGFSFFLFSVTRYC